MNSTNLVLNPFADLIITKLEVVKCDELFPGRSYIPVSPRRTHSLLYLLEGTLKYKRHEEEFIIKPDTIFFWKKEQLIVLPPKTSCRQNIFILILMPHKMTVVFYYAQSPIFRQPHNGIYLFLKHCCSFGIKNSPDTLYNAGNICIRY